MFSFRLRLALPKCLQNGRFAAFLWFQIILSGPAVAQQPDPVPATITAWPSYMPDLVAGFSESSVAAVLPADVVIIGGEGRLAFHGVDRIYPESSTLLKNGGRINLTLRRVNP